MHKLYIITNQHGGRLGSIQAVSQASAVKGFRDIVRGDKFTGIKARVAIAGERP